MIDSSEAATPFYPPHAKPCPRPLGFPFNLIKLISNNLEFIPEQAYCERIVIAPGPPRMAFVTDPRLVETLLFSRHAEFPKGRTQIEVLKPIFGDSIILSEGRQWRWQRGAAAPLFRHDELLRYGPVMSAAAEATVAKWRATVPGTVHNIDTDMTHAAFDVISNTMLVGGAKDVLSAIEKGHADYYRGINWWVIYSLLKLPHWLPRPRGQSTRAHETQFRNAVAEMVRQKSVDASTSQDLLGRLLRARDPETGQGMSEEVVIDNVVSFMMAGFDTTALSLAWTLFLISRSPEWEGRMLEEIEHVVGSGPVKASHVEQLHVVRQVLNESLRLFPTAPIILRDFVDDTELGGVTIPAGTISVIPIYAIHRHRSYWDDPDRFDPSRFSVKRDRDMRFQFMPFGAGPRICIGAAFAMMEATIMLATFVRAARFEVAPGFDPRPLGRMFLVARNGIPMRVTLRQNLTRSGHDCQLERSTDQF
jgi:cytochrome P450